MILEGLTLAGIKALFGPVVGAIGAAWSAREARKMKELEFTERAKERDHEIKVSQMESDNALRRQTLESDTEKSKSDMQAFSDSYKFANRPALPPGTKLTGLVKILAGLADTATTAIRPGMTIYYNVSMLGILIYFFYMLNKMAIPVIDTKFAQEIVREIIYSFIMLSETTLTWWFGIRMLSKRGKSNAQ
jgi:hypothetical protein